MWYARALFYNSLVLAITALVAVTQESVLLDDLRNNYASVFAAKLRSNPADVQSMLALLMTSSAYDLGGRESITTQELLEIFNASRRSKLMMFLWQCPTMLMSYSWTLFIIALTLHVLRPFLLRQAWSDDSKVRMIAILSTWGLSTNYPVDRLH